jgi:hypothetical protein
MLVEGLIIILDLDRFEEYTIKHGFDQYKPNIITGTLTKLVEEFVKKWQASLIYGLDYERGTEEAIIEIPFGHERIERIVEDLRNIKNEINKLDASISIVVVKDYVIGKPARSRREAYYGTPGRRRALRLLRKIKKKGGNEIVVMA